MKTRGEGIVVASPLETSRMINMKSFPKHPPPVFLGLLESEDAAMWVGD